MRESRPRTTTTMSGNSIKCVAGRALAKAARFCALGCARHTATNPHQLLSLLPNSHTLSPRAHRIVLMGQGGVGKTAMVLRFTTGDFNEKVRSLRSPAPA